jgi:hypothetical protein
MIAPTYPRVSRQQRLAAIDGSPPAATVSATASYTTGSPTVTVVSAAGLVPDMVIALATTIFPSGTYIVSIVGTTLTMSEDALATAGPVTVLFISSFVQSIAAKNVRLFQNAASISVDSVIGDFVEATFDGYAAKVLTLSLGYVDPSGLPVAQSQLLTWLMTGAVTPNTVYGYWIDDGVDVLMCALFDAAIGMAAAGAEISVVLQDSYPPGKGAIQVTP